MKLSYCDYCGEVIHNYYKMKFGRDLDIAITNKMIQKTLNKYNNKVLKVLLLIGFMPLFMINNHWVFCNQRHKDLFAKLIGLKKRRGKLTNHNVTLKTK